MSELKAKHVVDVYDNYSEHPCKESSQVYLKSEADKAIAELEKRIDDGDKDFEMADHQNEMLLQQNRELCQALQVMYSKEEYDKQKYKRCLDKAEMCKARYDAEDARVNGHGASWDYTSDEMKYWERWQKRWLELAEKFKEVEK